MVPTLARQWRAGIQRYLTGLLADAAPLVPRSEYSTSTVLPRRLP